MRSGFCELCGRRVDKLERHHESYRPERTIYICHRCHHKLHFLPWQLTDAQKEKLLRTRHGFKKTITEKMKKEYVPPGRRAAQLEVRKKIKKTTKHGSLH